MTNWISQGASAAQSGNGNPADLGYLEWTFDPLSCENPGGLTMVGGTLYLSKVTFRQTRSWTSVAMCIAAAASTPTSGQNFIGAFDSSGTAIGTATALTTTSVALTGGSLGVTTTTQAGDFVWVAWYTNASTAGKMLRSSVGAFAPQNSGLTAATYRSATNGTGLTTTFPSSITPSSNSASNTYPWAAIS